MSIQSLLNQQATIYARSGYNKYGRDIAGSGANFPCRFQNSTKTKLLPNGQTIMLVGSVYLSGEVTVNTEDRIVIDGVSYKVWSVNGNVDGAGAQRMIKLEVQKWQTT